MIDDPDGTPSAGASTTTDDEALHHWQRERVAVAVPLDPSVVKLRLSSGPQQCPKGWSATCSAPQGGLLWP